jgi:hypothetical protein
VFEFTLLVNRKHTDPEKSNLPVKKKKKKQGVGGGQKEGKKRKEREVPASQIR